MTDPREKAGPWSGGCQCGAVRYRAERLGRGSICHCRKCQKAMGGFFGPFVTAIDLVWTRGQPKHFQSSNRAKRGFCADCGTPLTFEPDFAGVELAIGTLDRAREAPPVIQVNPADMMPWFHELPDLPGRSEQEQQQADACHGRIVSHQHPHDDTADQAKGACNDEPE